MDSYNRGYGERVRFLENSDTAGTLIGYATVKTNSTILIDEDGNQTGQAAGFYAISYSYDGDTIISYRGRDGMDDVLYGWTVGAGWTDQKQADLSIEFYNTATGRDAFDLQIPTNITLTGHSLGGGLAGFVSMISGAEAVMFDHMPFGRAATDTYATPIEAILSDIAWRVAHRLQYPPRLTVSCRLAIGAASRNPWGRGDSCRLADFLKGPAK